MVDPLGTVAIILQLIDTALKIRDRIQDFCHAPKEQQKLLSEMNNLRPLLQELQTRIADNPSNAILQKMESPLADFEATMKQFTDKLRPGGGLFSKFSKRVKWTMGDKQEAQECLGTLEQFKSLLNSWLLVDLWCFRCFCCWNAEY
jgi:hypothetical protein